jgi:hypothetical protein
VHGLEAESVLVAGFETLLAAVTFVAADQLALGLG